MQLSDLDRFRLAFHHDKPVSEPDSKVIDVDIVLDKDAGEYCLYSDVVVLLETNKLPTPPPPPNTEYMDDESRDLAAKLAVMESTNEALSDRVASLEQLLAALCKDGVEITLCATGFRINDDWIPNESLELLREVVGDV